MYALILMVCLTGSPDMCFTKKTGITYQTQAECQSDWQTGAANWVKNQQGVTVQGLYVCRSVTAIPAH